MLKEVHKCTMHITHLTCGGQDIILGEKKKGKVGIFHHQSHFDPHKIFPSFLISSLAQIRFFPPKVMLVFCFTHIPLFFFPKYRIFFAVLLFHHLKSYIILNLFPPRGSDGHDMKLSRIKLLFLLIDQKSESYDPIV